MTENPVSDLPDLLLEFRALSRHDRKIVLRKMTGPDRKRLLDLLEITDADAVTSPSSGQNGDAEFAPWLMACLTGNNRNGFPALTKNFTMTEAAQKSLQAALSIDPDAENLLDDAKIAVVDESKASLSTQRHGPTLLGKMGDFFSRKLLIL